MRELWTSSKYLLTREHRYSACNFDACENKNYPKTRIARSVHWLTFCTSNVSCCQVSTVVVRCGHLIVTQKPEERAVVVLEMNGRDRSEWEPMETVFQCILTFKSKCAIHLPFIMSAVWPSTCHRIPVMLRQQLYSGTTGYGAIRTSILTRRMLAQTKMMHVKPSHFRLKRYLHAKSTRVPLSANKLVDTSEKCKRSVLLFLCL